MFILGYKLEQQEGKIFENLIYLVLVPLEFVHNIDKEIWTHDKSD